MNTEITCTDWSEEIKNKDIITDEIELHYTLFRGSLFDRDSYSVRILCTYHGETTEAYADDISSIYENAVCILDVLCSGLVTPCTLCDVLEDIL